MHTKIVGKKLFLFVVKVSAKNGFFGDGLEGGRGGGKALRFAAIFANKMFFFLRLPLLNKF